METIKWDSAPLLLLEGMEGTTKNLPLRLKEKWTDWIGDKLTPREENEIAPGVYDLGDNVFCVEPSDKQDMHINTLLCLFQ